MKGIIVSCALMLISLAMTLGILWLGSYWYLYDVVCHANKRALFATVQQWQMGGNWSLEQISEHYVANLTISVDHRIEIMGVIDSPRALRIRLITYLMGSEIVSDETVIEEERHEE